MSTRMGVWLGVRSNRNAPNNVTGRWRKRVSLKAIDEESVWTESRWNQRRQWVNIINSEIARECLTKFSFAIVVLLDCACMSLVCTIHVRCVCALCVCSVILVVSFVWVLSLWWTSWAKIFCNSIWIECRKTLSSHTRFESSLRFLAHPFSHGIEQPAAKTTTADGQAATCEQWQTILRAAKRTHSMIRTFRSMMTTMSIAIYQRGEVLKKLEHHFYVCLRSHDTLHKFKSSNREWLLIWLNVAIGWRWCALRERSPWKIVCNWIKCTVTPIKASA